MWGIKYMSRGMLWTASHVCYMRHVKLKLTYTKLYNNERRQLKIGKFFFQNQQFFVGGGLVGVS